MNRILRSVGLLRLVALGLALHATSARADVAFSDTAFNDANWQVTLIRGHSVDGGPFVSDPTAGSVNSSQQERGGVLGSYRGVGIIVNSSTGPVQNYVFGFHKRLGTLYNPAVSGPIGCVSYSEFGKTNASTESTGCKCQNASMALIQGGVIYVAQPIFVTPSAPSEWQQSQQILQNVLDFCAMPGYLEGSCVHPNFTQTGLPIEFGFIRGNYTASGDPSAISTTAGIDNWNVNVLSNCTVCSDGVDNDGDGCEDFPLDLGCDSPSDDTEDGLECNMLPQCSDGVDNDGDGCADYPSDHGCVDQADLSEAGAVCSTTADVPALSTWGLIALAAGLLGIGVYLLRRSA